MIKLRLPFPPSVNNYWGNRVMLPRGWAPFIKPAVGPLWPRIARMFIGKGQWPIVATFIEKPGVEFRAQVVSHMRHTYGSYSPSAARFKLTAVFTFPTRRLYDLGNLDKALSDALTHAGIWFDDGQVDEQTFKRGPVQKPGWVDVEITKIEAMP